ncbi:MAG: hypothetical protein NTNFB02_01510 [Nitrospira sp.]
MQTPVTQPSPKTISRTIPVRFREIDLAALEAVMTDLNVSQAEAIRISVHAMANKLSKETDTEA